MKISMTYIESRTEVERQLELEEPGREALLRGKEGPEAWVLQDVLAIARVNTVALHGVAFAAQELNLADEVRGTMAQHLGRLMKIFGINRLTVLADDSAFTC